jgi:hypothetical protein
MLSSDDDNAAAADGGGPWLVPRSERQKQKRRWARSSPTDPNNQLLQQQQPQPRQSRGPLLVGNRQSTATQLVAAKKLVNKVKKVVYYVDNLDPSATAQDLKNFVSQEIGVNVLTCFDAAPRRRPGDDIDAAVRKNFSQGFPFVRKGRGS